ncbi:MAG: class I SAM-dependent methyltransferase [Chloroflexi bacterium CFX4]|nr:class I SAM-dependent methyltransferase [Chloroflexi bacterium CFX4]MDL1924367.1 class I SAM-dependent methyltransferase [Chloroflexi bacterium CFX3]
MTDTLVCPACGSDNSKAVPIPFTPSNRAVQVWHQCGMCHAFFSSEPYQFEAEVAHTQQMAWGQSNTGTQLNIYKRRVYGAALDLLAGHISGSAAILDVGCSYGGFMLEAQARGYQVIGCDIVAEAVQYVRSLGLEAHISPSVAAFSRHVQKTFDAVTCIDVNCYWHNQPEELHAIHAILRPQGYLLMRVIDKSWLFGLGVRVARLHLSTGKRLMRAAVNDHRHSMPMKSLLRLLKKQGYRVLYASPKGALHSDQARRAVRVAFQLGAFIHRVSGLYLAPGALILAQKT